MFKVCIYVGVNIIFFSHFPFIVALKLIHMRSMCVYYSVEENLLKLDISTYLSTENQRSEGVPADH